MVTTSSNRGFLVPTVNADGNVWGAELDATFGEADTTLGGSLVLQSSAATNVTLSSSQAQNQRIVVQGQLNSDFILTFASSNQALGNYTIWNNSSAGTGGIFCQTLGGGATCRVTSGSMRIVNADGINAQFADLQPIVGQPAYLNKFRNAGMDVAQRGSPIAMAINTPVYTLDGWIVNATGGAAYAVSQVYNANLSDDVLRVSSSAGAITGVTVQQNIESTIAAQLLLGPLSSQVGVLTARFDIWNGSTASFTPTLATAFASSNQDNFGSLTNDLASTNLQACPVGVRTTVAFSFVPSSNMANGYQVTLGLGSALNTATSLIDITRADIRQTSSAALGLNANPAAAEIRGVADETAFCQRYFFAPPANWWYAQFSASTSNGIGTIQQLGRQEGFPVRMRMVPLSSNFTFTHTNCGIPTQPSSGQSVTGWTFQITATAPSGGTTNAFNNAGGSFSAEL